MANALIPASVEEAKVRYQANFLAGLMAATPTWNEFATEVPSNGKIESYPFMQAFPTMKEWLGPRQVKNLQAQEYRLENRKFEATVDVPRDDIEDDRIGLWEPMMQQLGESAMQLWDDLVVDALIGGTTALCYDGQPFFNASHPVDPFDATKGTQSNYFSGKALTEANYADVRASMRKLVDHNGTYLNVNPNVLAVPPTLEKTAKQIVEGINISVSGGSTQTAVMRGTARVVVIPRLESDAGDHWYLFDSSKAVKAMLLQKRTEPEFQSITDPESEHVVKTDHYLFGARARGVAGYGLWQLAARAEA